MPEDQKPEPTGIPLERVSHTAGSIRGSGQMAELVRGKDWSKTSLGPIERWPKLLLEAVNLVLAAPIPMQVYWGPQFVSIYNDALVPSLGQKHPASLGGTCLEIWQEAWPVVGEQLQRVRDTGVAEKYERTPLLLSGNGGLQETFWDYSFTPLLAEDGSVAGLLNVAMDVTRAVRTEEGLRASQAEAREREEYLRVVLDSSAGGFYSVDNTGSTTSCNRYFLDLLGFASEESVLGSKLHDIIHHTHPDGSHYDKKDCPIYQAASTGNPAHVAYECFYSLDGRAIPVEYWAYPIFHDGELRGAVTTFVDITQRQQADRELRESREQMKLAFEAANLAAWSYDPVAGIVRGDALMQELFQLERPSGPAGDWLAVVRPEDRERVAREFGDGVRGLPYDTEYRLETGDGLRWVRARARMTEFENGAARLVGICEDITVTKQNEAALRQTEKLAAVGRLASSIAHEINNPLEAVTNLLYLARMAKSLPEAYEYLDAAERELRRVSAICNQTLRFHRQSSKPTRVTCHDLFDSVLTMYQGRLINSHVQVERGEHAPKPILCFEGEMRQVLSNFIGNAIDAMHPRGGRLLLRSRCATDWKTGRQGLALTVADTGIGMSRQTIARLYTAFFTTKGISGTGLGLWVSRGIMERHQGSILVRSSQAPARHGTVFVLFLPFDAVDRADEGR